MAFNHPHNSMLINLFTGKDVQPITPLDWHRPLITKDVKWGKSDNRGLAVLMGLMLPGAHQQKVKKTLSPSLSVLGCDQTAPYKSTAMRSESRGTTNTTQFTSGLLPIVFMWRND